MSENSWGGHHSGFPPPPPVYPASPRLQRPAKVTLAATLSWAAAACWFLSTLLGQILGSPSAVFYIQTSRTVRQGSQMVTYTEIQKATPMAITLGVIAFAIIAGLWVGLIFLMRRGHNWARVTLTVLGVLGCLLELIVIVSSLASAPDAGGLVMGVLGLVVEGLVIAALIVMYDQSANAYFRRPRY